MIEAKYYKDFRNNYLIIENGDSPADIYQCKMITGNRIDGLLACQERHINGDTLLYYDITSRQSLASLYESRRINIKQLNRLFMQLKTVWEGISKFLLDANCLVLNPEFIYADVETEELAFLYYPYEAEKNCMVSLLEFLADRVDSEDEDAVEIVYKMLELVTKEQFVIDEVLQWFEQDYEEPVKENREYHDSEEVHKEIPELELAGNDSVKIQEISKKSRISEKSICFSMILTLILLGTLLYIYSTYQLSEKEQIYFYVGFLLLGIVLLALGACILYRRITGNSFAWQDRFAGIWRREKEEAERLYQDTIVCERLQEQAKQAYGNTIFIPWVESCENKLYGTGKKNKNHIDLNRLPLTVGKLAGSVDMVINDQSISRRHVKFAREGSQIYMTDLNSTNGTFKNGLRLQPNTSEILEPGDEIRLGKLKFIYR